MKPVLVVAALVLAHWLYDKDCCSDKHCHPVPCIEITSEAGRWRLQNLRFVKTQLKRSPDGGCHVCYLDSEPVPGAAVCLYLPPQS
jgi:hypothetical protein